MTNIYQWNRRLNAAHHTLTNKSFRCSQVAEVAMQPYGERQKFQATDYEHMN